MLTLALALVGLGAAQPSRIAQPIVLAQGKGVKVTQEHLDEAFVNLRATLASQGKSVPESQRATVERQLVEKLVLTQLLLSKATDDDRKAANAKATAVIEEQRANAQSPARFEAQVRAAGLDPKTFEEQLRERAICEEVLDRELRPELGVTAEKVRAYYDQHSEEFRQPERIRLRQIVLTGRHASGAELSAADKAEKKLLAERLLGRIRQGEDIAKLAREYSDDPSGRDRDGEYIFPIGRIVPELEVVILSMPTNTVSDVITTPFGFHIAKVIERLPGERVPFDAIESRIKARLELDAMQNALPLFQERLFKEADVKFTPRG